MVKKLIITAVQIIDNSLDVISLARVTRTLGAYNESAYHAVFYLLELLSGVFHELSIHHGIDSIDYDLDLGKEPTDEDDILLEAELFLKKCKCLLTSSNTSLHYLEMALRAETLFCTLKAVLEHQVRGEGKGCAGSKGATGQIPAID